MNSLPTAAFTTFTHRAPRAPVVIPTDPRTLQDQWDAATARSRMAQLRLLYRLHGAETPWLAFALPVIALCAAIGAAVLA